MHKYLVNLLLSSCTCSLKYYSHKVYATHNVGLFASHIYFPIGFLLMPNCEMLNIPKGIGILYVSSPSSLNVAQFCNNYNHCITLRK